MKNRTVLISGAGIAGPTLAYWLHRHGFRPTVVEYAPGPRSGGHAVDIRGTAREVAARTGILAQVRAAHTGARGLAFIDHTGRRVATMSTETYGHSGGPIAELAIRRTDLARILYDGTRDDVEYVFGDTVTAMTQGPHGVHVEFQHRPSRRFDLVIGADGVRSTIRRLVFGPHEDHLRDLGCYVALFTTATTWQHDGWQLMYTIPGGNGRTGRTAGLYPLPESGRALAGFFLRSDPLPRDRDIDEQKRIVLHHFDGDGWEIPRLLEGIHEAPDFWFDRIVQVESGTWFHHRTALLGDAGYCASPMSGIGTSLALVGAYVLAEELAAADGDHHLAYPAYQHRMRLFVERAQRFARTAGDGGLMPESPLHLRIRNLSLRLLPHLPKRLVGNGMEGVADTVTLAPAPRQTRHQEI